ncbi:MAG: hypothetical protein ACI3XL_02450 [Eubacteriales bacterium]
MQEIGRFGADVGIEIIPCIQTLAHLDTYLRWGKVKGDCDDILLADDERTYELIENIFKSLRKNFRTRTLHIGMDEAHMLGIIALKPPMVSFSNPAIDPLLSKINTSSVVLFFIIENLSFI